jgi:hypothetical protein
MKKILLFITLTLCFQRLFAQDTIPMLKGNVDISVLKGTIVCDFYLSNMPNIKKYVIRINNGMNIRNFRDTKNKLSLYYDTDRDDTTASGETLGYFLQENIGNHNRYLPDTVEFKYGGMYPVIIDSLRGFMVADWKGNVAFIDSAVRIDGYQSGWYPVLYDMARKKIYDEVKYDINISCSDCSVLYVNGCTPVKGTRGHFVSDVPREMAIFCGNYPTANYGGTWLLNTIMDVTHQKQFADVVNSYQKYYEQNLGIPYKGTFTFAQTRATAPDHAFSYLVSPTIFNVSTIPQYTLISTFDKDNGGHSKGVIAHELAHYYFNNYIHGPECGFSGIVGEGFAEFLSFKVTEAFLGDSLYQVKLKEKIKPLKYYKFKPWSVVKGEQDFTNREYYLYYYTPLLYIAIEREIGEKTMWKWLRTMLNSKNATTDYAFLERTFYTAVNNKTQADAVKAKYFTSTDALQNAIDEINKK